MSAPTNDMPARRNGFDWQRAIDVRIRWPVVLGAATMAAFVGGFLSVLAFLFFAILFLGFLVIGLSV